MYVYEYMVYQCIHLGMHIGKHQYMCIQTLHTCIPKYMCMYICIHVYMCVGRHTWAYMCVCMDLTKHLTDIYVVMDEYTYVHMYVCVCIYAIWMHTLR